MQAQLRTRPVGNRLQIGLVSVGKCAVSCYVTRDKSYRVTGRQALRRDMCCMRGQSGRLDLETRLGRRTLCVRCPNAVCDHRSGVITLETFGLFVDVLSSPVYSLPRECIRTIDYDDIDADHPADHRPVETHVELHDCVRLKYRNTRLDDTRIGCVFSDK